VTLIALNSHQPSFVHSLAYSGGQIVSSINAVGATTGNIVAFRLDSGGHNLWSPVPLTACSVNSGKGRLSAALNGGGMTQLVWSDARNDADDIYAQNINADGTFGPPPACVGDLNGDGLIDLTDLATLLANYGTGTTAEQGDLDGDGDVDLTDLTTLLAR